ncbi:hypothetical protein M2337_003466 [Sphingobium sp. B2D3A]|uniref:type-F conjugative transfer system protein TrbI n=1 Tax=unclassified Sphingobium TaxID=2611147 RepID=UPI00222454F4|nr:MULTISPECIES: type-F conjugative transfer system protein TrbI [unclassified Sphingobium]MCW2339176.1 hypothetical protein [Sphingobium sp. B2D3A]MCW2386880.1 hypothetical protein [Sphingobium sp. B2D3D]
MNTELTVPAPTKPRGFAGFSWPQLFGGVVAVGALVWGVWLTQEVDQLKARRTVSVSLSAMINDFVMAQARSGNSPEQVERETAHFMATLQGILKSRAQAGETILVSEAVISESVPDITPQIRAKVGEAIVASAPAPFRSSPVIPAMPQAPQTAIAPEQGNAGTAR